MKQFIKEWIINMAICLVIVGYIGIFFLGCYLLDDSTLKGAVYITLWAIFYAVTTITYYVRYCNRKKK
jgi:hypothetical protein|nr:MAG TPA: PsbA, PsbB, PsbC, PsbD, PsbE-FCP supercomplex, PLANT PROTEIN [Herelleviridae sp.]DAO34132.1 MAG TPA: PsbA, PsbB, PsbC, PsbD, PsbE-FCP supercomplex, PLANT PROTEIN [Caudoviricetes sp.]